MNTDNFSVCYDPFKNLYIVEMVTNFLSNTRITLEVNSNKECKHLYKVFLKLSKVKINNLKLTKNS